MVLFFLWLASKTGKHIRRGEYRPSPTGRAAEGSGYRCAELPKAGGGAKAARVVRSSFLCRFQARAAALKTALLLSLNPVRVALALSHQFPQPLRFGNGRVRISPNCEAIARRGTAERSETAEGRYAGCGGGRRRGLSTSHQTGFNSLAAARPVVASASFLSSRRARPPRQLAKGRRERIAPPRRSLCRCSVRPAPARSRAGSLHPTSPRSEQSS